MMTHNKKLAAATLALVGAFVGWGAFWQTAAAPLAFVMPERPTVVLFAGDIMLDRKVAMMAQINGPESLFATSTTALFASVPLRIANLEGTITDNQSIAQSDNSILRFTFNPTLAQQVLTGLHLSAVSLANNHSLDFGQAGYATTRQYLTQWGIGAFGAPFNDPDLLSTVLTQDGKTLCLVGYMELFNASTTTTVNEIHRLRDSCTHLVVFAHWGVEYSHTPTAAQKSEAHAFVDAGADMVVGAHPHVVEPLEVYQGRPIIYSLGNFMFDQDFSWATRHGALLRVEFYSGKTRLTFIPVTIEGELSSISEGADRDQTLAELGLPAGVDTLSLP